MDFLNFEFWTAKNSSSQKRLNELKKCVNKHLKDDGSVSKVAKAIRDSYRRECCDEYEDTRKRYFCAQGLSYSRILKYCVIEYRLKHSEEYKEKSSGDDFDAFENYVEKFYGKNLNEVNSLTAKERFDLSQCKYGLKSKAKQSLLGCISYFGFENVFDSAMISIVLFNFIKSFGIWAILIVLASLVGIIARRFFLKTNFVADYDSDLVWALSVLALLAIIENSWIVSLVLVLVDAWGMGYLGIDLKKYVKMLLQSVSEFSRKIRKQNRAENDFSVALRISQFSITLFLILWCLELRAIRLFSCVFYFGGIVFLFVNLFISRKKKVSDE